MKRRHAVRRWQGVRVLLLHMAFWLSMATIPGGYVAFAQEGPIDCPSPAASAAPRAESGTPVASPVVPGATFPDAGGDLTVFAAASLADAFGQMKADLEVAHPGLNITFNFAGSQTLGTQLNGGARADLFASANVPQMQAAIEQGSVSGEPYIFANNRLVLVTPEDNPAGIDSAGDLAQPDLRLVLAQPEVPAGRYARQAICAMGADSGTYGVDFVERVSANVVSQEEDVRAVLAKVQLGEADAGVVYVTDAAIAGDKVTQIDIPDAVNAVAAYPIAVVAGGDPVLAEAFVAYLLGPEGQATLEAYGFTPVVSRAS